MKASAPKPTANKQSIAVRSSDAVKVTTYKDCNGNEVSLSSFIINSFLAPGQGFTEEECYSLIGMAKARGLNPVVRDVYFQKYNGVPSIVVSRDYYEKRANLNANYAGKENGIVVLNRKEEIEYRAGTIMLSGEELLGGWCRVYMRNLLYPVFVSVQFDEATKKKSDGTLQATWASMPKTMIEKVAVVRALRQAMTEEFGGTYSADELGVDESELEASVRDVPKTDPKDIRNQTKTAEVNVKEAQFVEVDEATGEVTSEPDVGDAEVQDMEDLEFAAMQDSFFK